VNKPVIPIPEIRRVIARLLPAGQLTLDLVAARLDVSPRTLQRQLADHDLTLTQLVNQTRIAKACQRLAQQDVHISEIARETGFATPSSFSRAFQSWTGTSPRAFRKGL
jgi:AraC-like DNA-binding protein